MIRVLHVSESIAASGGGTSTAFVELIEALRTQSAAGRATVRALTQHLPAGDETRKWIAGHEPEVWVFTGPPGKYSPGAMAAAAREMIERREVDVVHIHGLWQIDLVAISRAARAAGIPVVWQPHGMLVGAALRHKPLKKLIFRHIFGLARELRAASAAVFTSDTERDTSDLTKLGRNTRREVVPLPVAIPMSEDRLPALARAGRERWLPNPASDPGRTLVAGRPKPDLNSPLLTFIGRLHPVKRVEMAISALAIIRREVPETRLLLIGDGEPEYVQSLRDLATREGVLDALTFAGWLNGEAKWQALAAGDALLIQSEFENFGYAIVESLVAGTPVVMTRSLSLAAAVTEIGAGVSCEVSAESLAAGAITMLKHSDRRALGHRGRRWVEASFSREAVGGRLVGMYEGLLR